MNALENELDLMHSIEGKILRTYDRNEHVRILLHVLLHNQLLTKSSLVNSLIYIYRTKLHFLPLPPLVW